MTAIDYDRYAEIAGAAAFRDVNGIEFFVDGGQAQI